MSEAGATPFDVVSEPPRPWNQAATSILRSRWEAGDPAESIAKATGSTVAGVRKQAAKLRLPRRESFWPLERVAGLKRLWSTGASFKAIGRQLGISRNAVAGARRRYDLADRARTPTTPRNPPAKTAPKPKSLPRQPHRKKEAAVALAAEPKISSPSTVPKERDRVEEELRVTSVLALRARQCRWIVGSLNESGSFCPNDAAPGSSWCSEHKARSFVARVTQVKAEGAARNLVGETPRGMNDA